MKKNNYETRNRYSSSIQGFTLLELLTGMAITTIAAALITQALVSTQASFSKDQKTVENGQKMSSVLEIIGREIRQSGELIVEPSFPTVQVKSNPVAASGSSIILYRAISEPVSLCANYAANTTINGFLFAVDKNASANLNADKPACTLDPGTPASPTILATDTFPSKQQEGWVNQRIAARNQISLGMIYDITNKITQPFVYTSESSPATSAGGSLNLRVGIVSRIVSPEIKVGNTAYLVEKREYIVCGTDLIVRMNSVVESSCANPDPGTDPTGVMDTIATNIEKLDITMTTAAVATTANPTPSPTIRPLNSAFPVTTVGSEVSWENIRGITVNIKPKDPLQDGLRGRNLNYVSAAEKARIEESFSSRGTFFPRNVLSSK
jgi:prepilin-type N-terminal cleavage/methylation domain-containing protein